MHKCFREVRCPQRTHRVSPFRIIHYSLYIIPLITVWITVEKRRYNSMLIHLITSRSHRLGISTVFCKQ